MNQYNADNVFAKIIKNLIPADKIYEDDKVLVIKDVAPAAPIHLLVIPKGEFKSFHDFAANADDEFIAHFFKIARQVANNLNLDQNGYRIMANHGKFANQTVDHFHLHILGGKNLGPLVTKS